MRSHKNALSLLLLPLLLPLIGCATSRDNSASASSAQNPCNKSSSIKGSILTISHLTSEVGIGNMLIDGTKEQQAAFDKVYIFIKVDTQIFTKQGDACQPTAFTALKIGQRVQVQSTGSALQSYPPQITATEIVVLAS